jgi:mannose-6-phosphate isomerase-like protein (cupin superfamily)
MTSEPARRPTSVRRVVTGLDPGGRATIVSDGSPTAWIERPTGAMISEIWRVDGLPGATSDESPLTNEVVSGPPPRGVVVCVATFPPDSEISPEAAASYAAQMDDLYGDQATIAPGTPAVPGMHSTQTIDVMTVVDGELWMVMEDGETCLRAGDSVVQRGTRHAWQNRSTRPATVVTTMMAANPS